jgi:mannose-6-phosphate isomerase-like protein (cupin superfamily)
MAIDYMDLHILKPECGIGIHRHRDNQEIFFLLTGTGIMVTGDWCQFPDRERCFEIRTMTAGSFSLLKPGDLRALFNVTDEDISLLMFGGYD